MALPFSRLPLWLLLAAGALWTLLFLQVHSVWSATPQYNYGWAVPLLALYLFWNRWENRPQPSASPSPRVCLALAGALLFALLPVSLIHEANHDWRLLNWAFALAVASLTALAVAWSGGRAWLGHFAFPLTFPLIAVPWPTVLEDPLVLSLMHVVSFVAVEGLNVCGVAAIQRGNVIEIGPGMVGVDEACSGIQSFQSALMVSLFLGELFQFSRARRCGMFGGAVLWAFLCNLARAFFLAWISNRQGLAALDRWHDHTGLVLMLACYGGIIALALALNRRQTAAASPAVSAAPIAPPSTSPATASASAPSPVSPPRTAARAIPRPILVGVLVWLGLVQLATEAWYRRREHGVAPQPAWSLAWPQQMPKFKTEEFSDPVRRMLLYDEALGASWQDPDGTHWLGYFFRWLPGNSRAKTTQVHNPEVCLPSGGMTKIAGHGRREYAVGALRIPFETFTFRDQNHVAHVFYCVWQSKISTATNSPEPEPERAPMGGWKTRDRLRNALHGERHFGQQVLEILIFNAPDFAQAEAAFRRRLPELVHPR